MHLGKEGAQESMKPVLWSRLGASAKGALGPIPVLTCKMTFRATLQPSLLHSLSSPQHWVMGREGVAWDGIYAPWRGHEKGALPPAAHHSHSRPSQCQWKAGSFPFLRRGWEVPKRDRIPLSIVQLVLKLGAEISLQRIPLGGVHRFSRGTD